MHLVINPDRLIQWLTLHRQLHPHGEWQRILDDPERRGTWEKSWLKTFARHHVTADLLYQVSERLHGQDLGFPEKQMARLLAEVEIIRNEQRRAAQERRRQQEREELAEQSAELQAAQARIDAMTEEQREVLRVEAQRMLGSAAKWDLFVTRGMRILIADGWEPPKNSNDRRHWNERRIQTARSD